MPENSVPSEIRKKIERIDDEVHQIIEEANQAEKVRLEGTVSFTYESAAKRDLLTNDERAQSICFVTRYENLPIVDELGIEKRGDNYYLGTMPYLRHALNEYRAIISNHDDSVHFQRIHTFCRQKMTNRDKNTDLVITAHDGTGQDVTSQFVKHLDEQCDAIRVVLKKCEFDYVYNGILQHSDHRFAQRLLREYTDGTINYVFIKHARLLRYIKGCLYWHHSLLNAITFPTLGPL